MYKRNVKSPLSQRASQRQRSLRTAVLHAATVCLVEPSTEAQLCHSTFPPTDPANLLIISAAGSLSPSSEGHNRFLSPPWLPMAN